MKLIINKDQISDQPEQFIRNAGYGFIIDHLSGKESFVRRLGPDHYPRFHMYIEKHGEKVEFNLHLDQKKASYPGAHAHNAEYGGPIVKKEMNRLRDLILETS